jgi:hypothetical protein
VWKAFIFDQTGSPKKIAHRRIRVAEHSLQEFFDLVNSLRAARGQKN